jgi:hypothetical protein
LKLVLLERSMILLLKVLELLWLLLELLLLLELGLGANWGLWFFLRSEALSYLLLKSLLLWLGSWSPWSSARLNDRKAVKLRDRSRWGSLWGSRFTFELVLWGLADLLASSRLASSGWSSLSLWGSSGWLGLSSNGLKSWLSSKGRLGKLFRLSRAWSCCPCWSS